MPEDDLSKDASKRPNINGLCVLLAKNHFGSTIPNSWDTEMREMEYHLVATYTVIVKESFEKGFFFGAWNEKQNRKQIQKETIPLSPFQNHRFLVDNLH